MEDPIQRGVSDITESLVSRKATEGREERRITHVSTAIIEAASAVVEASLASVVILISILVSITICILLALLDFVGDKAAGEKAASETENSGAHRSHSTAAHLFEKCVCEKWEWMVKMGVFTLLRKVLYSPSCRPYRPSLLPSLQISTAVPAGHT